MKKIIIIRKSLLILFAAAMIQMALSGCAKHSDHPTSDNTTKTETNSKDDHPAEAKKSAKGEQDEHPSSSEHPE